MWAAEGRANSIEAATVFFFAVFSAAAAIPLRRGIGKRRVRGGKLFGVGG